MTEKPLFIPLMGWLFDAFVNGEKDTEFRRLGPRWNAKTCRVGRPVILSRGYGKAYRLSGHIVGFSEVGPEACPAELYQVYDVFPWHRFAAIKIEVKQ